MLRVLYLEPVSKPLIHVILNLIQNLRDAETHSLRSVQVKFSMTGFGMDSRVFAQDMTMVYNITMGREIGEYGVFGPIIEGLPSDRIDTTEIMAHGNISPLGKDIDGNVRPWSLVWGNFGRKRPKGKLGEVIDASAIIPK